MSTQKISVILPNYNYARYLPQRIESILNQTYRNFELIILDDSSTDNSIDIIESFKKKDKRIATVYNNENSGTPFIQWQKGIELAKGEYIWVAEADDYCENSFLEKLIEPLNKNTNISLSYCQSSVIDADEGFKNLWTEQFPEIKKKFEQSFVCKGSDYIENYLIYQNVIPNASAVLFKKSDYIKVSGVDTTINNCADWLLWLKMLYRSEVSFIAEPLNYFRRHENSVIKLSKEKFQQQRKFHEFYSLGMRQVFKKWLPQKHNTKIHKVNNNYIAKDLGNKIKWAKKNESIFKAIKYSLQAFYYSGFKLNYIKKLITQ